MNGDHPFQPDSAKEQEKVIAFCQNCGKPLNAASARIVGQAVFCEPCLEARLAGAPASAGGYTPVDQGTAPGAGSGSGTGFGAGPGNPYYAGPRVTLPPAPPNPGLAALLGFIPGVGAMYNEQYAKGIVHLIVFAILTSLGNVSSVFGLMGVGWVFYMVIEAHHTARARRDGLALPNPFGLNDLSERLGFGRNWGAYGATQGPGAGPGPVGAAAAEPTPDQAPPPAGGFYGAPAEGYAPPASAWGAASDRAAYRPTTPGSQMPFTPVPPVPPYPADYGAPFSGNYGAPFAPPAGFAATPVALVSVQRGRFPAGALWLIGLGLIFLLATTGVFRGFQPVALVGFGLMGLAVWLFTRRMLDTGTGLANDGTQRYQVRLAGALGASAWILVVGFLLVLHTYSVMQLQHSWPWLIVLAGVMMLVNRLASNPAPAAPGSTPPYTSGPVQNTPVPPVERREGGV